MRVLSDRVGVDLNQFDLDGPLPELPPSTMMQGHARVLQSIARRRNMTIRQLRDYAAVSSGHRVLMGTPEQIADDLEAWFKGGACDGFVLAATSMPGTYADFVARVVPELQRRGLYHNDYAGATLRENLGLRTPRAGEWKTMYR